MTTLYVQEESGFRKASADDVIASAQGLISQRFRRGSPVLSSPARVREFLSIHLGACESEIFGIIHLDHRHRSLGAEDLFRGTIDGAAVYPRIIVKSVLARNSAAAVCYHNHPLCCFGNCHPLKSRVELQGLPAQRTMTRRARRQGNPRWRGRAAARSLTACAAACVVSRAGNVA